MKTIKFWSFLLITALAYFSFTSCGNDDDEDDNINASDLVGSWKRIYDKPTDAYLLYNFTADKRFNDREYYNDGRPAEPEGEWDNYEIKGNIINISWDESSKDWEEGESNMVRAKILKLTSTELSLQWEDMNEDGSMYWGDIYNFQKIIQ